MSELLPTQLWWSAEELAASGLPDLPATKRGVNLLVERQGWRAQTGLARRRPGKGGGWEYSWRLLPSAAQRQLLAAAVAPPPAPKRQSREEAWTVYEALPDTAKQVAQERLAVVGKVAALEPAMGRARAIAAVAQMDGLGARTIWGWFSLIEGIRHDDRLPYLAPRNRTAADRAVLDCSPEFYDRLKTDYLRVEQPSFSSCYRRAVRKAAAKGWDVLPERTMRRRIEADVSAPVLILCRKGIDALKRMYPPQVRDKSALTALEAVNADFHKFDVFVRWPAPAGEKPIIGRAQMVAFQDVFSGRILSWRVDVTPNSTAVLLAAGDMIETWGIPEHVLLDNGREFAAKVITGGTSTRYRFKVKEDDIPGLFTALGCTIHWATPYAGQSKPIERAFRDMCDSIAKDPRFAGAWTGNKPEAKPENYGSRAIDLEQFLAVVAEGIEEHNTRIGRRSEVAFGRSFAEVFDESYQVAPIRKATEAQRRLWLLGAEGLRTDARTGIVRLLGNQFWADWMHGIMGERIIARFDPANLHDGIHVYSADNRYLGHAPCSHKAGFFDMDEARAHARNRNAWLAAEKRAAEAHRKLSLAELGRELDAVAPVEPGPVEAKVVRGIFPKPAGRPQQPTARDPAIEQAQAAIIADFAARRGTADPAEESPRERFRRALELERQVEAGGRLTRDQDAWLGSYRQTAEYRAERMLWDDMGDAIFG